MGARVIKVEPPDGDSSRAMAGSARHREPGVQRRQPRQARYRPRPEAGHRARRVPAARTHGRHPRRKLPARRHGAAGTRLRDASRRRTRASCTPRSPATGRPGPRRRKGGFDLVAQGASGIMSVTGEPGRPPVKAGLPITNLGAGLFALAAILAAVHWRSSSGRGQYIDTSLFEAGLALSVWEATEYFSGHGARTARVGPSHDCARTRRFAAPTAT